MSREPYSQLHDWELENAEKDLRGRELVDKHGRSLGKIHEMLVDTHLEEVVSVTDEEGREYAVEELALQEGQVWLLSGTSEHLTRRPVTEPSSHSTEHLRPTHRRPETVGSHDRYEKSVSDPVEEELRLKEMQARLLDKQAKLLEQEVRLKEMETIHSKGHTPSEVKELIEHESRLKEQDVRFKEAEARVKQEEAHLKEEETRDRMVSAELSERSPEILGERSPEPVTERLPASGREREIRVVRARSH